MRFLLALTLFIPLAAQEQPPAPKPAAEPQAEAKTEAKPEEKAAESPAPAPAAEQWISGSLDFGYRWRSDVQRNFQTYRSVVNLGEGPKLFGADFSIQDPKHRLFDRIDVRGAGWGGDPYTSARLGIRKLGSYDLQYDYRNIAYFNFLQSFANVDFGNPLLGLSGGSERAFDLRRRMHDVQLDFRPGKRIVPYLAYSRDSGSGRGITTFVGNSNEYPVADTLYDKTDNFRGGVRFEMNRLHVTLEQGGTTFKDDQDVFTSARNPGNRTTPLFGTQLILESLNQAYRIRGDSIYSKVIATAHPVSWADLYGQFLFSQPTTDTQYSQTNVGQFAIANPLLFFNNEQAFLSANAKQPHTMGTAGVEVRPFHRLRVIQSWTTDRLHDGAFALLTDQLLLPAASARTTTLPAATRFVLNYNQSETNALFDIWKFTIRGGYRAVWGDAQVPNPSLLATPGLESGSLRRNVGLAGLTFRMNQKLSANFDYEGASSDRAYFRTSLRDYQRVRARARYQANASLGFSAYFSLLSNDNPAPGLQYDYLSRNNTFAVYYTPGGGKRVSVTAEYSRSTLHSNITYLMPQELAPALSSYSDNAHTASSVIDLGLPSYAGMIPKISFGGSLFISSGSRASRYYQPLARLALPLHKNVQWTSEWRWYGFGEQFYLFEGFRAHVFMTGLRLAK